jgi:TPR repeat protein
MTKNLVESVRWFRKTADQGYAGAQYESGEKYEYGDRVKQDIVEVVSWYRKAADQGHAKNKFAICALFAIGQSDVEQDYSKAVSWYRKAAEKGLTHAMACLGLRYANGEGVKRDHAEAMR